MIIIEYKFNILIDLRLKNNNEELQETDGVIPKKRIWHSVDANTATPSDLARELSFRKWEEEKDTDDQSGVDRDMMEQANFDEEVGDLLWVTIGNLIAIQNPNSRTRIKDLVIAKNAAKNKEHYAIRRDTNKLISIHKPQKWIGAEAQMREEWEKRGLLLEET